MASLSSLFLFGYTPQPPPLPPPPGLTSEASIWSSFKNSLSFFAGGCLARVPGVVHNLSVQRCKALFYRPTQVTGREGEGRRPSYPPPSPPPPGPVSNQLVWHHSPPPPPPESADRVMGCMHGENMRLRRLSLKLDSNEKLGGSERRQYLSFCLFPVKLTISVSACNSLVNKRCLDE